MTTDWTEENIASCISVIDGVSPSDAIEAIIPGEPQRFASREEAEAWAYDFDAEPDATRIWVAAGEIEGHTFVWEDNGFGGSDPGTAERLSANGRFVSVYWNVNGLMSFTFAEHERIEANFDALFAPEEHDWKTLEDVGATRISDDDWEEAPEISALLAQSQILGLSTPANPAWLDADGVEFWGTSY